MERRKSSVGLPGAQNGTGAGPGADGECWNSISYLESAFHYGFMRSRLKNGDFVYQENTRLTRELDEFCDVDAMHQPKGPILLLGESGMGKSTFLANWLVRRKKMFQNWQSSYPEFIFYHVVGCSRQSCFVSNLLERILREMKEYFELNKEIPEVEERLSWQFPRFLEAASKKGRVLLIIDGLQRLRTNDGESILKWVPLVFPPNVRLIFTGTINYPATKFKSTVMQAPPPRESYASDSNGNPMQLGGDHHDNSNVNALMIERIKLEANRRKWTMVYALPLSEDDRRRLLRKFLNSHPSNPSLTEKSIIESASASVPSAPPPMTVPLQLFDLQQKAIVSLPMAASPHFLKIFLTSLAWAVTEGFDIHVLFEQWLAVDSLAQLLEAVVRCMETGFLPDEQSRMDAKQFLMENNYNVMLAQDALVRRKSSNRPPGQYLERTASRPSTPVDDILGIAVPGAASTEFGYRDARLQGQFAAPPGERRAVVELNFDVVELPQASQDQAEAGNHKPNTPVATMSRTNSLHETKEMFVSTSHSTTRSATGSGSSGPDASGGIVPGVSPLGLLSTSARRQTKRASFDGINVSMTTSAPKLIPGTKELPVYLSGGRYVPPLGELLGQALCLLYVSRHGMLVNELRYILNAVVLDTRENEQQNQLHRKSSFSNVRNMGDDSSLTAFSEDEWKALMRAMRPLGLLFFQNVIVLPICKEVVRDLVWWRYIGSEKVEQQYHQWMIRFFRIHPTTFRRVEELPWHLKRCFQWDALRHVLVNLAMFQLLYTANFKTELFGYWKTLTDGPLLLYNTDPPVFTKPFDIVREYGRSIDDWYRSARPPTKTFTPIVQLVTKFMHEFSLYYQGTLPPFQHAPFELRRLYQDGFTFVEDLPHVHSFNSASAIAASASSSAAAAAPASPTQGSLVSTPAMMPVSGPSTALLAALDAFASLGQTSAGSKDKEVLGNWFSFYQRWIWIHFPWLALGKEIVLRDPVVTGITVFPASQSNNSQLGSGLLGSLSSPGGADLAGLASLDSLDHHHNVSHGQDGPPSSPVHGGRGSGGAIHLDTHFWDVKKSMLEAAEIGLKGVPSAAKISALQNSSIAASTATTQTLDVISPDNVFHKKATYAAVKNVLSSSVRSLPTAIANTTGPGGLSSVPELTGAGGATFLTEQALSPLQVTTDTGLTIEAPSITAQDAFAMSSKKTIAPLATHEIGMDRLTTNDNVGSMPTAFGLPAHAHDYPQTEWDLKKSYNLQVMLKLQTLYDSVKVEVHRKQSYLHTVKLKIADTAKRYELTMRECDMARHAMEEMSMRMNKLEAVVCNIDRQEKAHRKLIRSCELFPACNPSHFEDLKKELRLLQMKLKDLTAEKRMLHSKKVHLQGVEVPALQKAIARNKELLGAVVDKLEKAREKMMQEQAASDKLYQRRVEMIESVRTTDYKDTEASLVQKTSEAAEHATSATTRSLAAKVALQQCESMCEKIQKATGFTKLELILQKFVSREELNRSFEEQAKIYEARLKQIKMHQAELEQQLRSLEVSSAVPPTDDPRMLDEKLRVAEVELARIERTQNNLLTTSKEVIAGASRIIKLMGITSCNNPYKNAIPAAQLWPPPQGIDGENSLMSEFETLEPKEIAQLLQICQDRAMSMIDMIDGGRGDPDTNFERKHDEMPHSRNSLKVNDKASLKTHRVRRHHGGERRERGFDRGFLPAPGMQPAIIQGSAGNNNNSAGNAQPDDPADETEDGSAADVLSRDAIKASSKSKLTQKKRSTHTAAGAASQSTSSGSSTHHLDTSD